MIDRKIGKESNELPRSQMLVRNRRRSVLREAAARGGRAVLAGCDRSVECGNPGRAQAVLAAMVKKYFIAPARLIANGGASLAPVAPNTNEDGRARNRRVEQMPQ